MGPNDLRAQITSTLAAEPAVLFATLFGSQAAGTARPHSDWDVAVLLADGSDRFETVRRLSGALPGADVVVLNDAPALLAHRALQGERLLVRDRSAWVRFFVKTLGEAGDEAHWRELHARARATRLEEGRFGRS